MTEMIRSQHMAKRKRKSAAVYDYDAAFTYGLMSDRVGAEITAVSRSWARPRIAVRCS